MHHRTPLLLIGLLLAGSATAQTPEPKAVPGAAVDAFLDSRWLPAEARAAASRKLAAALRDAKLDCDGAERLLRAGRVTFEPIPEREQSPPGKLAMKLLPLACEHVDYTTGYFLFVPEGYDAAKPAPLLIVAHGGNSAMMRRRAVGAAVGGTRVWLAEAQKRGFLVAAPISQRGWLRIGNSVALSLVSKLTRRFQIDPDRIYVTGHSMGGHMTWRSALSFPDRFAAFVPMSGGYDYVARKQVQRLFNVSGYATYCEREPYGIDRDNKTLGAWLAEHGYDWRSTQGPGSHTIPVPELPKIAQFLVDRPRNMYPAQVYAEKAGSLRFDTVPDAAASAKLRWQRTEGWKGPHTWNKARPIDVSVAHWIRFLPRDPTHLVTKDPATGEEKKTAILQTVWADNKGSNNIELTTENVRELILYLHPKMVDFAKPITVRANGKVVFEQKVKPDLATMLDLVHEFDDRGRIYHASIRVTIDSDQPVPIPNRKPK